MKASKIRHKTPHAARFLQGEDGSVLTVALLTITLMVILGLVLLQFVQQGLKSSAAGGARISAEALAQKGLDESLSVVEAAVEAANTDPDYRSRADWLEKNMRSILNTLPGVFPGGDSRESYTIELESAGPDLKSTPIGRPESYPDYPYVRKITVRCTGRVQLVPAVTVTKRMTLYVNSINPVMRYAVSANVDDSLLSLPAGDPKRIALQLNGAPYIVGNVFAGGDLSVSGRARFVKEPGVMGELNTSLPAMRGFYKVTGDIQGSGSALFDTASVPLEDPKLQQAERVDVRSIVDRAIGRYIAGSSVQQAVVPVPLDVPELTLTGNLTGGKRYDQAWVTVEGAAKLTRPVPGQSADVLVQNGLLDMLEGSSLKISGGSLLVDSYEPDLVVANLAGAVELDEGQALVIHGNTVINDGFQLKSGNLFVQGDLKIYGNVNLYGTVYVDGNVEMRDLASINGTCRSGGACSPLIIAASGTIELGEYVQDQETRIHGFLYANRKMKIYGVYSKLNFIGGLHADEGLELNAAKGNLLSVAGAGKTAPVWERFVLPNQSSQPETASRLDVSHDINLYEAPPEGIPVTDTFNVYVSEMVYDNN